MLRFQKKKDAKIKKDARHSTVKRLSKIILPIHYMERRRFQWLVTIFATTVVLFIGVWGYNVYDRQYNIEPNWSDNIYRSFSLLRLRVDERHRQLATPDNPHSIPWQLHVTRIFLPITLLLFGMQSLAAFLRLDYRKKTARMAKGHIIICGETSISEIVAKNFAESGFKVVLIGPVWEISRGYFSHLEEEGIILVGGTPNDKTTLTQCGIRGAGTLLALEDSETRNIEILLTAKSLLLEKKRTSATPLRGIARIQSVSFYQRLLASDMPPIDSPQMSTRVFGESSATARMVWNDLSWYRQYLLNGGDTLHSVIFGFGSLGESLLLCICMQAYLGNIRKRIITVFDIDAENKEKSFLKVAPWVEQVCSIRFVKIDLIGVFYGNLSGIIKELEGPLPQLLYVCLGNDNLNFQCAMDLSNSMYGTPLAQTHVKVRILNKPNLINYLKEVKEKGRFLNISFFGGLDELYHPEILLDETTDTLAKEIHRYYCDTFNEKIEPWERLPESLREANRQQADSVMTKVISLGYLLGENKNHTESQKLKQEDIETLAELEHERWMAERISKGWSVGEHRNDIFKIHPSLIGYDRLNDREQEKDENAVRSLFKILPAIGFNLVTEGCVCLLPFAESTAEEALSFLEKQARQVDKLTLISPLISKLDRIIARKALRRFDIRLFKLIPISEGIPIYEVGIPISETNDDLLRRIEGILFAPLPQINENLCDNKGHYIEPAVNQLYSVLEERLGCICWRL